MRFVVCFGVLLGIVAHDARAVPVWGARESLSVDTAPAALKPGQWVWGGDRKTMGPMAVIVSLTEQRAYAYRNGILIGFTTISSGKPGHETPTGVFTILQKDKNHHSDKYNDAPMPYQERLTWDGVALHAGGLPGYPESHGCVHLPTEFARLLFDATNMGMTVVVADEKSAPVSVAHPKALLPIDPATGAANNLPPLDAGEDFRWDPANSPDGPVSMVLSRSDQRLVVYRNGREIGRARIAFHAPATNAGTRAYIVSDGFMPGTRMPNWIAIGVPGHGDDAGKPLAASAIDNVTIPPQFVADVLPLLTPGVVLVATDEAIREGETENRREVLDSDPPEKVAER